MRNGLGFGVIGSMWPMVWSGLTLLAFALLSVYWVKQRSRPVARKVQSQAPSVLRALEQRRARGKITQEGPWITYHHLNNRVEQQSTAQVKKGGI